MKRQDRKQLPLVYSCSGCSSAAQMTNSIAVQLNRNFVAEMSCIAGVGGDVPSLVKAAKSGRKIVALDGCPLQCVASCLERHGLVPDIQHVLSDYGVKKRDNEDFSSEEADAIYAIVVDSLGAAESESSAKLFESIEFSQLAYVSL